ncbi:MAG TPA: hypothetical protein VGJ15_04990 [Pirellulales bacterium]
MRCAQQKVAAIALALLVAGCAALVHHRAIAAEPKATIVYTSNFAADVPEHWSRPQFTVSPSGRKFLGQFLNDEVRLSLVNLPPHKRVRLSFDLITFLSWDGSDPENGPDIVDVQIEHGPRLLHATFTNPTNPFSQSYPGTFGIDSAPPQTGGQKSTLGYNFGGVPSDTVYRIERTFGHSENFLTIVFSGKNLTDEFWGLDNVVVEVLDEPKQPANPAGLEKAWQMLGDSDPMIATQGISRLVDLGDQVVPQLQKFSESPDAPALDAAQAAAIQRLIDGLDADDYQARENASDDLAKQWRKALPLLHEALDNHPPPETKARIHRILTHSFDDDDKQSRRLVRLVFVLELLNTDRSRGLLGKMVDWSDNPSVVVWGGEALKRITAKAPDDGKTK